MKKRKDSAKRVIAMAKLRLFEWQLFLINFITSIKKTPTTINPNNPYLKKNLKGPK